MEKISKKKFNLVISLYPKWKELNKDIKSLYSRGINFHEVFSEFIICYINDYYHSLKAGSEDAVTNNNIKVQIKSTSNYDSDLTSFGPTSEFEILEFARLNQELDLLYVYKIPINDLYNIPVNKFQTFREQQKEGRRPRFSIIKNFIEPYNLNPYVIINMKTGEVYYQNM